MKRLSKTRRLFAAGLAAVILSGCGTGATRYTPRYMAPGEIALSYDDGYTMYADGEVIAEGSGWNGLESYVACSPPAKAHASSAETIGGAAKGLSVAGAVVGVSSLGTLTSLAVVDKQPKLTAEILGAGVGTAAIGVVLAIIGRRLKSHANGHAIDAMNHYNDEVGSGGRHCRRAPSY